MVSLQFEEEHELDLLEDTFEDLPIHVPTTEHLDELHKLFIEDFENNPIFINEVRVKYNKKKSIHPLFKGKSIGFEHVCTRESSYSNKRNFDRERANKIHWIKPCIEHVKNYRVTYFERLHHNGKNQRYYWFRDRGFVVIIREIQVDLQLITAFCVDELKATQFKRWNENFKK
jgi:hypothetical protein